MTASQRPPKGDGVVFLVSLPRSGSTLLQRLLARHPRVETISEPWIALHPIFGLRFGERSAVYDTESEAVALEATLAKLPDGRWDYISSVGLMLDTLYLHLRGSSQNIFIDKTPRYHLIIDDLAYALPAARFIFLVRHPGAVVASMLNTWGPENLHKHRSDLLEGPTHLISARQVLGRRAFTLRYEDLVTEPQRWIKELSEFLGIGFDPRTLETSPNERWPLGDQSTVYAHSSPLADKATEWFEDCRDPQVWRAVSEYMSILGEETTEALGYNSESTTLELMTRRPNRFGLSLASSFPRLLKPGRLKVFTRKSHRRLADWIHGRQPSPRST